MSVSKTFCIYPWDHLATLTNGDIIPCCVAENDHKLSLHNMSFQDAWNSETLKNIRKKMMQGEPVQACQRCFAEEASGIESHRVQSNRYMLGVVGPFENLIQNTTEDGTFSGPIRSVDLRLSNTCNLKCIMCRPNESSKWASELAKVASFVTNEKLAFDFHVKGQVDREKYGWHKNPKFWETFYKMLPDIREMIIGGGEPFLINEQNEFLKKCVEMDVAKDIKIRFHTNGTILPDDILNLFGQFKQIEIMVSLDGVSEQNYFMRYPANWETITNNLKKLDNTPPNVTIFILSTMHAMSIFYFPELIRWVIKQNFKKVARSESYSYLPATGIVHHPSYINPRVLPKKTKELVRQRYELLYENELSTFFAHNEALKKAAIQRLNSNLDYMDAEDCIDELPQFLDYIQALDKARGTNFKNTFPELATSLI